MGHRRRRPSRPSTPLPFHRYLPPFHRDLSERYRCLPRSIGPRWHSRGWAPLLSLPAPAEALSLQHPRFLVGEGSDPLGKGGGMASDVAMASISRGSLRPSKACPSRIASSQEVLGSTCDGRTDARALGARRPGGRGHGAAARARAGLAERRAHRRTGRVRRREEVGQAGSAGRIHVETGACRDRNEDRSHDGSNPG